MQMPPPPIVSMMPAGQQLETWVVGVPSCADGAATLARAPDPMASVGVGLPGRSETVRYLFTIDASGRPLDLRREGSGWVAFGDDLGPALAAARFMPGMRQGCAITFTRRERPLAAVPIDELFAVAAFGTLAPTSPVRMRIDAASGDCGRPYPVLRLAAYPDDAALPRTTGGRNWTVTRFDIDAGGRPNKLSVAAGSGNAALDRAARDAMAASRFRPGARHGCTWPHSISSATLPAPPAPEEDALRPAGATCPRDVPFDKRPMLTMPQPWQRRSIEGWAVVAYDVAPWGAIGNARVLAAEPAAEFGDWAMNVLRYATKRTSGSGYTGCVDRVRFRIGDQEALRMSAPPTPPLPPID